MTSAVRCVTPVYVTEPGYPRVEQVVLRKIHPCARILVENQHHSIINCRLEEVVLETECQIASLVRPWVIFPEKLTDRYHII